MALVWLALVSGYCLEGTALLPVLFPEAYQSDRIHGNRVLLRI